jgi:hypothetical protein
MTGFWKLWMTLWCWCVVLFGVALAAAGIPALEGPMVALYRFLSGGATGPDVFVPPGARFSVALMGAVSIGWGLSLFPLVSAAQKLGAPVWRALTFAVLSWFVIDSFLSWSNGFALNAASNTLLLLGYLIPVLATGALNERAARA